MVEGGAVSVSVAFAALLFFLLVEEFFYFSHVRVGVSHHQAERGLASALIGAACVARGVWVHAGPVSLGGDGGESLTALDRLIGSVGPECF